MDLHVPPELEARLNRLAADTGRNADQVALDLLANSVEHDDWRVQKLTLEPGARTNSSAQQE